MDHEQVSELAAKLIEIMIDPARARDVGASSSSSGQAGAMSVDERNAARKAAGEHLQECVDYLVSSLTTLELSETLAAEYEKYMPEHINDEPAAK